MANGYKRFANFKDFYIWVGAPGAYSANMQETRPMIALWNDFNIMIKHAPYSIMPKIKNVVVQSWKDEDGDDVWLPRVSGTRIGTFKPAITHEAVEFEPTFVIYNRGKEDGDANLDIINFVKEIEGRWLKLYDTYTGLGYSGVYLLDVDDDPKFKRRDYEHVEFTLKFKVNGISTTPFEDIETAFANL